MTIVKPVDERPFFETFYPDDLGSGFRYRWTQSDDLLVGHQTPDGSMCAAYVNLGRNGRYELVSLLPLTIAPLIVCAVCSTSGYISGGLWVPF